MKKLFLLKIPLLSVLILLAACQPVSEEAYQSAYKATSITPDDIEEDFAAENDLSYTGDFADNKEPDFEATTSNIFQGSENQIKPEAGSEMPKPSSLFDGEPFYNNPEIVTSPYGLCYNLSDNVLVYGKSIDKKIYPASVTKLLTAIVALKYLPSDFIFDIGSEVWMIESGSISAGLEVNNKMDLESMLTALLVPSGNDAAYSIAVNTARYVKEKNGETGDFTNEELVKSFVVLMNEHIKVLGLQDSHFENPDGYHDNNHFSTLRDLLKISAAAAENSTIVSICSKSEATVYYQSGKSISWNSRLSFLGNEEWGYKGMKIGFTDESLYSATVLSEFNGKRYISIVSGCETSGERLSNTVKMLSLARDGYEDTAFVAYEG